MIFEVIYEFLTQVFTAPVRVDGTDISLCVVLDPSLEFFVGDKGVRFIAKKIKVCQTGVVIDEGDEVSPSTDRFNV